MVSRIREYEREPQYYEHTWAEKPGFMQTTMHSVPEYLKFLPPGDQMRAARTIPDCTMVRMNEH